MNRLVVDRTGLEGQFDIKLEWADPTVLAENPEIDRPSFVTALQEQLGLKIEQSTELVEVLVIDRIEQPSPD